MLLSELELRKIIILKTSSIYESLPFETDDIQGNYLNMAVMVSFDMGPFALLENCLDIENKLGRIRPYPHAPGLWILTSLWLSIFLSVLML